MKVIETEIPGVLIIEPRVLGDARGYFLELWNEKSYAEEGLGFKFVQDNLSFSVRGVLRGLHFQHPHGQGKLVGALAGEVFDVAVDIRPDSPTYRQWVGVTLSAENHRRLYIPEGFAHGFVVTSESALFTYKCTDFYNPKCEGSIRWDDPELAIDWPIAQPLISGKDAGAPALAQISRDRLPSLFPRSARATA